MCGFFAHIKKEEDSRLSEAFQRLKTIDLIKRRGPDEQCDVSLKNAYFFHSRLSLMGEFGQGRQPYRGQESDENSGVLLFNGGIYNYKELSPQATSDTSVLYEFLQSEDFKIDRLNGAFCFSYYDPRSKRLKLFRDRVGIRPLFYVGLDEKGNITEKRAHEIIYSTNLIPIVEYLTVLGLSVLEDEEAIRQYSSFRFIREPSRTFFKGIKQLSPGSSIKWSIGDNIEEAPYWKIEDFHTSKRLLPEQFSEEARFLLKDSIHLRGVSNTPICSFLSGGLDSGLITSIGLDKGFIKKSFHLSLPGETNELRRFKQFLHIYPHNHQVLDFIRPDLEQRKKTLASLEQPIGDSIIYLIDQLFKESSKDFKIALSGDGADELFGGYIHHRLFQLTQVFHRIFPDILKDSIISLISKLPLSFFNTFFPYNDRIDQQGVLKLVSFLRKFPRPFLAYTYLVSLCDIKEESTEIGGIAQYWQGMTSKDFTIEDLLAFDIKYWGPGYSLYKIDRLSFSYGQEVRTPFYDHRLVELCVGNSFVGNKNIIKAKSSLQRLCRGLVDKRIIEQPKFPFRIKDHYLKNKNEVKNDLGVLKGKEEVCVGNYLDWKNSLKGFELL